MGYTFWIAVIGCVTGLISLAVEVARYLAERPHIQVRTYDELNNLIYIQEDVVKSYIHLQILNTGTRHILLQDAYLKHPGAKKNTLDNLTPFRQAYEQMPWKYYNGNDYSVTGYCPPACQHSSRRRFRMRAAVY